MSKFFVQLKKRRAANPTSRLVLTLIVTLVLPCQLIQSCSGRAPNFGGAAPRAALQDVMRTLLNPLTPTALGAASARGGGAQSAGAVASSSDDSDEDMEAEHELDKVPKNQKSRWDSDRTVKGVLAPAPPSIIMDTSSITAGLADAVKEEYANQARVKAEADAKAKAEADAKAKQAHNPQYPHHYHYPHQYSYQYSYQYPQHSQYSHNPSGANQANAYHSHLSHHHFHQHAGPSSSSSSSSTIRQTTNPSRFPHVPRRG